MGPNPNRGYPGPSVRSRDYKQNGTERPVQLRRRTAQSLPQREAVPGLQSLHKLLEQRQHRLHIPAGTGIPAGMVGKPKCFPVDDTHPAAAEQPSCEHSQAYASISCSNAVGRHSQRPTYAHVTASPALAPYDTRLAQPTYNYAYVATSSRSAPAVGLHLHWQPLHGRFDRLRFLQLEALLEERMVFRVQRLRRRHSGSR